MTQTPPQYYSSHPLEGGFSNNKNTQNLWSMLNLRVKATLIALLLGVIPIAGIGGIVYNLSSNSIKKKIIAEQESRTLDLAHEVGIFSQAISENIKAIANSPLLTNPKLRATTSQEQKITSLDRIVKTNQEKYENIAVLDLQGNLLFQSRSNRTINANLNYSNQEHFQRAIATQAPAIKNTQLDPVTGQVSLEIAAPIRANETSGIWGIILVRIPITYLDSMFETIISQGWEYKLIDTEGKIFAADEEQYIGHNADADFSNWLHAELAKIPKKLNEKIDGKNILKSVLTEIAFDNDDRVEVLISLTSILNLEGIPEPGWKLAISRPEQEAFAPITELGWTLLVGTGAAALLIGAIAAKIAKNATRPILSTASAVVEIGQGELHTRIPVSGSDEMALLSLNINQMASQLEILVENQIQSTLQERLLATISSTPILNESQLESLFQKALDGARNLLQLERTLIYRINLDGSAQILQESVGEGYDSATEFNHLAYTLTSEIVTGYLQQVVTTEPKSQIVVPIYVQDLPFALFAATHSKEDRTWLEREINFAKHLASQLGIIIERVNLLSQQAQETQRSQWLQDITLLFSSLLDSQSIYESATKEVREVLKTDRVLVYSLNSYNGGNVSASATLDPWPGALGEQILRESDIESQYASSFEQGIGKAIADIQKANLSNYYQKQLEKLGVRAKLVAPIKLRGKLIALFIAHQCSHTRTWLQPEIDLFTQVATQIGLALERVQLLEEQKTAKEQLQQRALKLLEEIDPVAQGDLRVRARVTGDEIGTVADFYNATIESLHEIVVSVKHSAHQVTQTASANQMALLDLLDKAQQQSSEISLARERVQEMALSMASVTNHAEIASGAMQNANLTVIEGEAAMNRTVNGMEAIRETVVETAKKLKTLGESSKEISLVVNLINNFAEQTSLLALNSSVEAARAGEHGRGFAIVAQEVRSLARQSAEATVEIEEIVAGIIRETAEVLAAMEAGTHQVMTGTTLVEETKRNLEQIAAASSTIQSLVEAITTAAAQQSQQERQALETMDSVAAISQLTSQEATAVSSAFNELLSVAQNLQHSVDKFKVTE